MNAGWTQLTMAAGAGTGTWRHMGQLGRGIATAEAVELVAAPIMVIEHIITITAGAIGFHTFTLTATGVTVASTHGGDSSVIRLYAFVIPPPPWYTLGNGY